VKLSSTSKNVNFFSFTKFENRKEEQVLWGGEEVTRGRGLDLGKECRKVNMVRILCTHVWKWENETC
jgi:hypothetical protein